MLTAAFVLAATWGTNAYAQQPLTFGVKGGMNLSNFAGDIDNNKAKVGFNVGLTVDYQLASSVYLLTGLEYTTKGTEGDGFDASYNLGYLQLPVHVAYKLPVSQSAVLVLHGGPYLAYALNGNYKEGIASIDLFHDFENVGVLYNRFDAGFGIGAGMEFGKFGVGLGVDYGLANINKEDGYSMKNFNSSLSVSYKF